MNISFSEIDKNKFESLSLQLYNIFAENMNKILMGDFGEKERDKWIACISEGLTKSARKFLLINDADKLVGFFMYYVTDDKFMMEEIQLSEEYQGQGVFRQLYKHLINQIPSNTKHVEAYANKGNHKSRNILTYLGLSVIEKKNDMYLYRGDYATLKQQILNS